MKGSDVIDLYSGFEKQGLQIWIDGGWAVDALLGQETRLHGDLDIVIQQKDITKFRELLTARGYKEIKLDIARPHNFVLADEEGHEIDVHVIMLDDHGNGIYGPPENGEMYPAAALTGSGTIIDHKVRSISPEYMIKFLAPLIHKHPDKYLPAVSALCEKYGVELPEEYNQQKS